MRAILQPPDKATAHDQNPSSDASIRGLATYSLRMLRSRRVLSNPRPSAVTMHRKHLRQSRSKPHSWQAWTTGLVFETQPGDLAPSRNLRIRSVGPEEKPFGSG